MAKNKVQMSASQAAGDLQLEVEVTGLEVWKWRVLVCVLMIRLGAWVAGMGVKVTGPTLAKRGFK